jgi:hypothetical protein
MFWPIFAGFAASRTGFNAARACFSGIVRIYGEHEPGTCGQVNKIGFERKHSTGEMIAYGGIASQLAKHEGQTLAGLIGAGERARAKEDYERKIAKSGEQTVEVLRDLLKKATGKALVFVD